MEIRKTEKKEIKVFSLEDTKTIIDLLVDNRLLQSETVKDGLRKNYKLISVTIAPEGSSVTWAIAE